MAFVAVILLTTMHTRTNHFLTVMYICSSRKISLTCVALIDSVLVTAMAGLKPYWKIGRYSDSSGGRF
jgi:hypothetical protein